MLSPIDLLGKSKQEAYNDGMRLLRTVGLAEKALNYPDELSGGQKHVGDYRPVFVRGIVDGLPCGSSNVLR